MNKNDNLQETLEELNKISENENLIESIDAVNKKFMKNIIENNHIVKIYKNGILPFEASEEYLDGKGIQDESL